MQQQLLLKEYLKKNPKKTAEATEDLIGNKVADKINSVGKTKNKGKEKDKEDETNKSKDIYIPPEKRQQTIDDLRLLQIQYKNGIPKKIKNLLDTTSDNVPRFITKKGQKFMISLENHTVLTGK